MLLDLLFPFVENVNIQTEISFNNTILRDDSGKEQRIVNWIDPLRTFNISKNIVYRTELNALVSFHESVQGSRSAFWYKDKSDFASDGKGFLVSTGVSGEFQVCKRYELAGNIHIRPILKPIGLQIRSSNILVTNWTLGLLGKVTFSGSVPANLSLTFEFYVPVRFEEDSLERVIQAKYRGSRELYSVPKLILKEVKLTPNVYPVDTFNDNLSHLFNLDLYANSSLEIVYSTEVVNQSSGYEKRVSRASSPVVLTRLQNKRILRQFEIDYLINLWLTAKGEAATFKLRDAVGNTDRVCRFASKSLTYTLKSVTGVYEVASLELRVDVPIEEPLIGFPMSGSVLTKTRICQIALQDGEKLGFTSLDRDLTIDGVTYEASTAIDPSAAEKSADLSVDNGEIKSILSSDKITESDLLSSRYRESEIIQAIVDWRDLPTNIDDIPEDSLQVGIIGEVRATGSYFVLENLTKAASLLKQARSKKASPNCPYEFGDRNCQKDLSSLTRSVTIAAVTDPHDFTISTGYNDLAWGKITFTSGANEGNSFPIYRVNGSRVILYVFPSAPVAIGDAATVVAGCDRSKNACTGYSNYVNFGGFPTGGNFMPGNDFYLNSPKER
jgi:uncharacterized phage protein (TIGR02218 family)/uncharacterized protein (TIGR02217 family)